MSDLPPPPQPPTAPPPPNQPPTSQHEAKAQAKAAKAYAKASRPWFKKKRFILGGGIIAIVILMAVASGDDSDDDTTAGGNDSAAPAANSGGSETPDPSGEDGDVAEEADGEDPEPSEPSGDDTYAVGEPGNSSDLEITVLSVEDPWVSDNQFIMPDAGKRYIGVEMSITNGGDRSTTFSEHVSVEVVDADNQAGDVAFTVSDRPSIGGSIPSGATRTGWLYLEVDESANGIKMRVKGSFTASGAVFALG